MWSDFRGRLKEFLLIEDRFMGIMQDDGGREEGLTVWKTKRKQRKQAEGGKGRHFLDISVR